MYIPSGIHLATVKMLELAGKLRRFAAKYDAKNAYQQLEMHRKTQKEGYYAKGRLPIRNPCVWRKCTFSLMQMGKCQNKKGE